MANPTKVPEAVLKAYQDGARKVARGGKRFTAPELQEAGLAASIDKYNEGLLSQEAMDAAARAVMGETQKRPFEQVILQAAIDSVMKGEG